MHFILLGKMKSVVSVLVGVLCLSVAKDIPSYIKRCSLSDPNREQCFIKHGYEAIPFIIKGDRNYNYPSLNPLLLDKVEFNAGNLKVYLTDMKVYGLADMKIASIGIIPEENKMYFNLFASDVNITAHYRTKGRILLLPIEGDGPLTIRLLDGEYNCSATFENFSFDAKDPIKFIDSHVQFYAKKSHYNFENLFGGNRELGNNINKVLNENHESLNMEFNDVFAETINTVIRSIAKGVINDIYFRDGFLP